MIRIGVVVLLKIMFYCFEILQLYVGQFLDSVINVWVVFIYQISFYVFNDVEYGVNFFGLKEFGNIYICLMNFIIDVFEKCVVVFEGGVVVLVIVLGQLVQFLVIINCMQVGDNFVLMFYLYGGIYNQFKVQFLCLGIDVCFVEGDDVVSFVV